MRKAWKTSSLIVAGLIVLVALSGLVAACADSGATTSTTSSALSTAPSSPESEKAPERVVIDGSTAEEYETMLPELQEALAAAPEDLELLQELAIAQFNTGRLEEAASTYEKMLSLKDDGFTRNNYGNALRELGRIDEAKAAYETSISMDPTDSIPHVNLASVLAKEGNVQEAIAVLDRALGTVEAEARPGIEDYKARLNAALQNTGSGR